MKTEGYPRSYAVAALCVALAAGAYFALHVYDPVIRPILEVLPPFAIAIVFAFLLDPVVDWFQKRRMSREFGVAIVGLSFVVVFVVVGFLVIPNVADQAGQLSENFPKYSDQAQRQVNRMLIEHESLLRRFHLPTTMADWTNQFSSQGKRWASSGFSVIATALTSALGKILWVIIIPLSTLWLLRDLDYIKAKALHFVPEGHRDRFAHVSSAIGDVFGKYVRGMIAVSILYSIVTFCVLAIGRLDYALIIGGVAGLLYMVPYVGVFILIVATGIAAIAQPGANPGYAAVLMLLVAAQNVVFDMVITPKVVGGSVGVHPVLSLFALAVGAQMFGVAGMILAVPCAAACQVALGHWYPKINDDLRTKRKSRKKAQKEPEST